MPSSLQSDPVVLNFLNFDVDFDGVFVKKPDVIPPLDAANPMDVAQARLHIPHLAERQNKRDRLAARARRDRLLAAELAGLE